MCQRCESMSVRDTAWTPRDEADCIVFLAGGSKQTQAADIRAAPQLARGLSG